MDPDPDSDPNRIKVKSRIRIRSSQKSESDPKSEKAGNCEAMDGRGRSCRVMEAHNGASEALTLELTIVCRPEVADSHSFDEESYPSGSTSE